MTETSTLLHDSPASFHDSALDSRDLRELKDWSHFHSLISVVGIQILQIWELPRRDAKYYIGVDVADGIGANRSAISVVRAATITSPFEEVAQYVSADILPIDLAYVVDTAGRFYSDSDGFEAKVAVETNNHGLATHSELDRHLGYTNFYIWQWEDSRPGAKRLTNKAGWFTSKRTRPLLITRLFQAVTSFDDVTGLPDLIVNSPHTFDEMRDFQTQDALANAEAAPGATDDCLFALGIAYFTAQQDYFEQGRETIAEQRRRLAWQTERDKTLRERRGMARDFINTDATAEDMNDGLDGLGDGYSDFAPNDPW